jgi:PAS domain S-box-containing protein
MSEERIRILLIEDNPGDARLIRELLAETAVSIPSLECFERLPAGLKRVAEGGIDVILLDLGLPDSQGLDTFFRTYDQAEEVPIVVLTGLDDKTLAMQAMRAGAQDYLIKGRMDGNLLIRAIRYAIERKQSEKVLRESENKLRAIVEHSNNLFYSHTTDHILTYVSPQVRRFLDCEPEEAMIRWTELATDNPVNAEGFKHTQRAIDTGERQPPYQLEVVGKKGRKIWVEANESPVVRDGKTVAIVGALTEITDRKRAEEEKKQLHAQLQRAEKMEAIGTLAGGVAHDLNNILSGLVSYPDLLLEDLPEDSPLRDPILTIQKSGKKAAAIVHDLLTLARRGVTVSEVSNLTDIITDYLGSPEHEKLKAFHPCVKFETSLETDLVNTLASPVHLSKTVMNLVSNAAEALPDGGKVTISTKNQYVDRPIRGYDDVKEGDYAVLTVNDNGIGISAEDRERIFEPFYTKKVMGRSGTGLGMAVVWGTVKDHKGYIDIQGAEGKGTRFDLYFPVTRKKAEKDKAPMSIEEYMGNGKTILVVDDVQEQREIASMLLTKLGYCVNAVSSGDEAVEHMKRHSADLLVLDMIMDPGIDGLDTYKQILELHSGQKAIIASGFSESDRVKEAQRLGAGQYVRKPYTLEKIGVAVKRALQNALKESREKPADCGKEVHILLAEDYPINQQVATRHLHEAGYQVDLAENGRQAVEAYKRKHYDLILMDIEMPVMDGYEATRAIRNSEKSLISGNPSAGKHSTDDKWQTRNHDGVATRVPIIAMTGHATTGCKERCLEAGMDNYIAKPLKKKELLATVEGEKLGGKESATTVNGRSSIVTSGSKEDAPMDLDRAIEEFEGDREYLTEVLEGFLKNVRAQLETMGQAISNRDADLVRKEAHAIKGGAGNLTAEDLAGIALELENIGTSGDLEEANEVLERLEKEFHRLKLYATKQ